MEVGLGNGSQVQKSMCAALAIASEKLLKEIRKLPHLR